MSIYRAKINRSENLPILTHTRSRGVSTITDFSYNCFLLFPLIFRVLGNLCFLVLLGGMDALKFSARHSPYSVPAVAVVVVVRVVVTRIEEEAPRVVVAVRVRNRRPIPAGRTGGIVERSPIAGAGAREKDAIRGVRSSPFNNITIYTIHRRPSPIAFT